MPSSKALLIIVMGVSGCGKSTLAERLSKRYHLSYIEADDFHPAENKAHMAAGKPLSDAMREPWIQALCNEASVLANKCGAVMAYSGLKRAHRARFRRLGVRTIFLHLHGSKTLIAERMGERGDHFMPLSLLDSQFDALEPPTHEPDVHFIDLSQSIEKILHDAENLVEEFLDA